MHIIPSLLFNSEETFLRHLNAVQDHVESVQIDIGDGIFVPKNWADPEIIKKHLRIPAELHLMVKDPAKEIEKWRNVDNVRKILFHFECGVDPETNITFIKSLGFEASVVLNPETNIEAIENLLPQLRSVMLMGVIPGKQGQPFVPETIQKIKALRARKPKLYIEVDGAVNEQTLPDIITAGANAVCPGSAIFGNERTPEENVRRMKEIISKFKFSNNYK